MPHRFRISRFSGRAIFQYMLFSPNSGEDEVFLPKNPVTAINELTNEDFSRASINISLRPFAIVDGISSLQAHLGLHNTLAAASEEQMSISEAFKKITPNLRDLETQALLSLRDRMHDQSIGAEAPPSSQI